MKKVSRFLRGLLSRRDWVYLLSLLTPFVFYNLALKASTISIAWESVRLGDWGSLAYLGAHIYLMGSDIAFSLGYVLLWVGIFAAARRGLLRWTVVFLFHVITILIVIINTSAHQYFQKFGTTLDYEIIAFELPRIKERAQYGWFDVVPLSAWVLMGVALLCTALGPWLLTRFVGRWRGWPERPTSTRILYNFYYMSSLGLCSIALLFGSLSLLIGEDGPSSIGALAPELSSKKLTQLSEKFSTSFVRDPFVNVVMTAGEAIKSEEPAAVAVEPPPPASLVPTTASERRNVVLILLESTRDQYTTPYNEDLDTTPFLNELAKSSLLAEQAYTVMPTTSKANVAANCGIAPSTAEPVFGGVMEAAPSGIPNRNTSAPFTYTTTPSLKFI